MISTEALDAVVRFLNNHLLYREMYRYLSEKHFLPVQKLHSPGKSEWLLCILSRSISDSHISRVQIMGQQNPVSKQALRDKMQQESSVFHQDIVDYLQPLFSRRWEETTNVPAMLAVLASLYPPKQYKPRVLADDFMRVICNLALRDGPYECALSLLDVLDNKKTEVKICHDQTGHCCDTILEPKGFSFFQRSADPQYLRELTGTPGLSLMIR